VWQFFAQTKQKADVSEKRKAVVREAVEDKAMLKGNQLGWRNERANSSRQKHRRLISFGGEKQGEELQLVLNKCKNG
jgi:hypothetical protein